MCASSKLSRAHYVGQFMTLTRPFMHTSFFFFPQAGLAVVALETKGAFMKQSGPWISCQIVKRLLLPFQIIPGIEGTRVSGHSSVCPGLPEEQREGRPAALQPAGNEVAASF